MMRMIAAVRPLRPDFSFLTGWEAVLVPMLLAGADGGTHATSGVVPELTRQLFDLTRGGQIEAAMRLQYRLLELFDAMIYSAEFPEGFRSAVALRGFAMGRGRHPQTPVQEAAREKLQRVLQCLLADFGFVQPPLEGCPARSRASAESDPVERIAKAVADELRQQGLIS
jgi:4-hydroxy-tetrahydrodipicolinate synthase